MGLPELLFESHPLGDIMADLDNADGNPLRVLLQRPPAEDINLSAIFSGMIQFALPAAFIYELGDDFIARSRELGFEEFPGEPPHRLLFRPSVNLRCSIV